MLFLCSPFFTFFITRKNASLFKRLAFFAIAAAIGAWRGDNSHFAFIKQACRAYLWGKKGFVRGCFVLVKAKKAVRVHTQKKASPLFGHLLAGVAVCTAVLAGLLCASAALLCRVDIPLEMDGAAWHRGIVFKRAGRKHRNQPYTRQKRVVVRPVVWRHCGSFWLAFFRHARPTVVFYLHSHQGRQYFTVWWGRRVRRHFMEGKP